MRVRSTGLTSAAVEAARIEERSIVRHWVMRMTVHLFPADDFGWLTSLYAERITNWSMGRLVALGLTESERDRALAAIAKAVRRDGKISRAEAMQIAQGTGIEVDVGRRTHLAVITVMNGTACIGPDMGRTSTFVETRDWVGEQRVPAREDCLAELARRYFGAFAPATERDFAKWSGLSLGECRLGMEKIAGELISVGVPAQGLFAPKGFDARVPRSPVVRLLPAFDTYLMGYASRSHAVDDAGEKVILPGGGVLRPTICVDGRFAGTWSKKRSGQRLDVSLEPFEPLREEWLPGIEREAADIARFEGIAEAVVGHTPGAKQPTKSQGT